MRFNAIISDCGLKRKDTKDGSPRTELSMKLEIVDCASVNVEHLKKLMGQMLILTLEPSQGELVE